MPQKNLKELTMTETLDPVADTVAAATTTQELLSDVLSDRSGDTGMNDVNKAGAIRRALQVLGSNARPGEIAEYLKREHGISVSTMYVSCIKSQTVTKATATSYEAIRIAKRLVKETGSVAAARNALDAIQQEQESIAENRNRYQDTLKNIDTRLGDSTRPLTNNEKRELMNEKRKVAKLLTSLEEM